MNAAANQKAWTLADDAVLIEGALRVAHNKELAQTLGRSVNAVQQRLMQLRHRGVLPKARLGRRSCPPTIPGDAAAGEQWAKAIVTIGRLLPAGMRVVWARGPGDAGSTIDITYPDGDHVRHAVAAAN